MKAAPAAAQPDAKHTNRPHWPTILQFVSSGLAILGLWSLAASALVAGLLGRFLPAGLSLPASEAASALLVAAGTAFAGVLVLPSLGLSGARMLGRRVEKLPALPGFLRPTLLIFAFPLIIAAGYLATRTEMLTWLLLPPVHILAIGLPVLWLLYIAIRNLSLGGPQTNWGVFAAGTVLGPAIILVLEIFAMLFYGLLIGLALSMQPELAEELTSLAERLASSAANPAATARILGPYLLRPGVVFLVIVYGAAIVPMIEEVFKPIGVWLLVGRKLSPAQGFVAGALCGAGYAIFESLLLASSGEAWAGLVSARSGTSAIHIAATALMGWGLASAWGQKRYLRLGLIYLLAVSMHGLWNGLTLISALASLGSENAYAGHVPPLLEAISRFAPVGLITLALVALLLLAYANYKLSAPTPAPKD